MTEINSIVGIKKSDPKRWGKINGIIMNLSGTIRNSRTGEYLDKLIKYSESINTSKGFIDELKLSRDLFLRSMSHLIKLERDISKKFDTWQ